MLPYLHAAHAAAYVSFVLFYAPAQRVSIKLNGKFATEIVGDFYVHFAWRKYAQQFWVKV